MPNLLPAFRHRLVVCITTSFFPSLSHLQWFSCSLAQLIVKTFNYNETNGEAKCLRRVVHLVRHSVRQCVSLSLCQPVHASVQLELATANYVSNVVGKSSVLLPLPLPPLIALRDPAKLTQGLRGRRGTINCKPWTLTWTRGEGRVVGKWQLLVEPPW